MPPIVVADIGSHTAKVGIAGEEEPGIRCNSSYGVVDEKAVYGMAGLAGRGVRITNPFEPDEDDAAVQKWDAWLGVLSFCLREIGVDDSDHLTVIERGWATEANLRNCLETVFEHSDFTKVTFIRAPSAASFHLNKENVMVVESGHSTTSVSPVLTHETVREAIVRCPIGGKQLTMDFGTALVMNHVNIKARFKYERVTVDGVSQMVETGGAPTDATHMYFWRDEIYREVKEAVMRVDLKHVDVAQVEYILPDGQMIRFNEEPGYIGSSLFTEAQSQPPLNLIPHMIPVLREKTGMCRHYPSQSLPAMLLMSSRCVDDLARTLLLNGNIVTIGGTTIASNFTTRLESALYRQLELEGVSIPQGLRSCLPMSDADKLFSPWKGGSIYGSWSGCDATTVTREAWEESGGSMYINAW